MCVAEKSKSERGFKRIRGTLEGISEKPQAHGEFAGTDLDPTSYGGGVALESRISRSLSDGVEPIQDSTGIVEVSASRLAPRHRVVREAQRLVFVRGRKELYLSSKEFDTLLDLPSPEF